MKKITNNRVVNGIQGVYVLRNERNGKVYVGSSCENRGVGKRLSEHQSQLTSGTHPNIYLQRSWIKDAGNFSFYLLECVSEEDKLIEREQFWIDHFDSADRRYGYNLCPVAGTCRGRKLSESHKTKIGSSNLGKRRTEDQKKAISMSMVGKNRWTDERRERFIESHSGEKHWLYGKKHKPESIEKMKASHKDKIQTEESVAKRAKSIRMSTRRSLGSSQFKGVCWDRQNCKWRCTVDGRVFAGCFELETDAALNYDFHMIRLYGIQGCYLNFPDHDFTGFVPKRNL